MSSRGPARYLGLAHSHPSLPSLLSPPTVPPTHIDPTPPHRLPFPLRPTRSTRLPSTDYDVIIIGAGHNGLTAAAYLAKAGLRVISLERRNVLGGATLTDEIFPGYRLPRYSYAALLLRGQGCAGPRPRIATASRFSPSTPSASTHSPTDEPYESGTRTPRSPRKIARISPP